MKLLPYDIFKPVSGYEDLYEVSNMGRVKSLKKGGKGRIMKPKEIGGGYLIVDLCKGGKIKPFLVHRIIAMTFLDNSDNLPEVNHKNGIRTDNRVENLEWVTKSKNQQHRMYVLGHDLSGERNPRRKLSTEDVLDIFNSTETNSKIASKYNISVITVSDIKRGYSWNNVTGMKRLREKRRWSHL